MHLPKVTLLLFLFRGHVNWVRRPNINLSQLIVAVTLSLTLAAGFR